MDKSVQSPSIYYCRSIACSIAMAFSSSYSHKVYLHNFELIQYKRNWSRLKFVDSTLEAHAIVVDKTTLKENTLPTSASDYVNATWIIVITDTQIDIAKYPNIDSIYTIGYTKTASSRIGGASYIYVIGKMLKSAPENIIVPNAQMPMYNEFMVKLSKLWSAHSIDPQLISSIKQYKAFMDRGLETFGGNDIISIGGGGKTSAINTVIIVHISTPDDVDIAIANKKKLNGASIKYICVYDHFNSAITSAHNKRMGAVKILIIKSVINDAHISLDVLNQTNIIGMMKYVIFMAPYLSITDGGAKIISTLTSSAPCGYRCKDGDAYEFCHIVCVQYATLNYNDIISSVYTFKNVFEGVYRYLVMKNIKPSILDPELISKSDGAGSDVSASIIIKQ